MENDVNLFNKIIGIITIIIYTFALLIAYITVFEIINDSESYGSFAGAFILILWELFSIISVILILLTKLWKQIEKIVYILNIEIILGIIFTIFIMFNIILQIKISNVLSLLLIMPTLLIVLIPHIINGILAYKGFINIKQTNI